MTPPATTALNAAWARTRRTLGRGLGFTFVLCAGIALLISLADGGAPLAHAVYAFAIGTVCWLLITAMRLLQAAATDAWRRARHETLDAAGYDTGWRGVVPAVIVGVLFGPPMGMALADWLTGHHSPSMLQFDAAQTRITVAMTALASVAALFVLSTMERLARSRADAESARRQAAEAQLALLQSQLEPHMLFNTLANLRVLIGLDATRAQEMLDRLIAFLRATLAASRAPRHPLGAEFERLDDYLALMAVRMGPRLQVRLALPPALAGLPVPPLLLQPLVENSIQHGLEPKVEGGRIEVTAAREGDRLVLSVQDSGIGLNPNAAPARAGGGFGLTQVRERLATAYGAHARLQVQPAPAGAGTLARVELPLTDEERR